MWEACHSLPTSWSAGHRHQRSKGTARNREGWPPDRDLGPFDSNRLRGDSAARRLRTAAASAFALLAVPACGQVPVASPEPETPSESPASAQHASPTAPTPATPIPSDFAQTLEVVESGVVMVRATTCSGTGIGSGFLVGPGQIVTAAHVVDGAVSVAIAEDDTVHRATVTGLDTEH